MEIELSVKEKNKPLVAIEEDMSAQKIVKLFDRLEKDRAPQLRDIAAIRDEIYTKNEIRQDSWRAELNLPDIYELSQTLKSHLIENLYSHPEGMFDVAGASEGSQDQANLQKAVLVETFEKMDFSSELEKIIDSIVETGEVSAFVGWKTATKSVRRRKEGNVIEFSQSNYEIKDKTTFDGPCVKYIPAQDFVFDTESKDRWDSCGKIYRTYQDLSQILENQANNQLTPTKKLELEALLGEAEYSRCENGKKGTKNGKLEILEYWGDFKLQSGKVLKNWLIVVAGRKNIIRFEPNPFITNPFVYANIIEDPRTQRGVSPLKIAVGLNRLSSTILNKQLDALSLMINPPYLAPKGCFTGEQEVKPGKVIEYDSALMPQQPVALRFDTALRGWDFIQHFKTSMESATGIYRNMSGNIQPQQRTATELTYSLNGQAVRLGMIIETVNRKIIIPIVEKTADLLANFKTGAESIAVRTSGGLAFYEINEATRENDYIYKYGDRKSNLERKYRFKEIFDVVTGFSKISEIKEQINWVECFKFALEQYGIENSENFLKKEDEIGAKTAEEIKSKKAQIQA